MIKRFWLWFKFRDTPFYALAEQHNILIRLARRCAYDFAHAADFVPKDHWLRMDWPERAGYWTMLFGAGNPGKDYRLRLHDTIDRQAAHIEKLEKFCDERGLFDERPHDGIRSLF